MTPTNLATVLAEKCADLLKDSVYVNPAADDTDFECYVAFAPANISEPSSVNTDSPTGWNPDEFLAILRHTLFNKDQNGALFEQNFPSAARELKGWLGMKTTDDQTMPDALKWFTPLSWLKIAIERVPYRFFVVLPSCEKHDWQDNGKQPFTPADERFWIKNGRRKKYAFIYKRICWLRDTDIFANASSTAANHYPGDTFGKRLTLFLLHRWVWHLKCRVREVSDGTFSELCLRIRIDPSRCKGRLLDHDAPPPARTSPFQPPAQAPHEQNSGGTDRPPDLYLTFDSIRCATHPKNPASYAWAWISRHSGSRDKTDPDTAPPPHYELRVEDCDHAFYGEGISGLNSHFGEIEQLELLIANGTMTCSSIRLALELLEQALVRVELADERLQDAFSRITPHYFAAWIADQKVRIAFLGQPGAYSQGSIPHHKVYSTVTTDIKHNSADANPPSFKIPKELKGNETDGPDVLVVHQGLLDKFDEASKGAREQRRSRLCHQVLAWKDSIPFVVVTSGRGRPDEIPAGVKFVPVSAVPNSAVGACYEKMVLWRVCTNIKE